MVIVFIQPCLEETIIEKILFIGNCMLDVFKKIFGLFIDIMISNHLSFFSKWFLNAHALIV